MFVIVKIFAILPFELSTGTIFPRKEPKIVKSTYIPTHDGMMKSSKDQSAVFKRWLGGNFEPWQIL
jgi:hypothetical protein